MGRTSTKKTVVENTVEKVTPKNSNILEETLRQENDKLRSEIDEIKKMMISLSNQQTKATPLETIDKIQSKTEAEIEAESEIRPNKYIKVISLVEGILVLSTQPMGQGKVFVYNKFGETKNIIYSELAEILHCNQSFAESGKFYIVDKNTVYNHGLVDFYKKILTKDMIEGILDNNQDQVVDTFKNATDAQKETIVSIITNRIINNQEVDLNKVNSISKIYGKDILEMAEEAKQLLVVS